MSDGLTGECLKCFFGRNGMESCVTYQTLSKIADIEGAKVGMEKCGDFEHVEDYANL